MARINKNWDLSAKIASLSKTWSKLFEQYMIVIIIVAIILPMLIILGLLNLIPSLKSKVKEKTIAFKEQMLFNGIIRSVQVSYMKNSVGFQVVLIALIKSEQTS